SGRPRPGRPDNQTPSSSHQGGWDRTRGRPANAERQDVLPSPARCEGKREPQSPRRAARAPGRCRAGGVPTWREGPHRPPVTSVTRFVRQTPPGKARLLLEPIDSCGLYGARSGPGRTVVDPSTVLAFVQGQGASDLLPWAAASWRHPNASDQGGTTNVW